MRLQRSIARRISKYFSFPVVAKRYGGTFVLDPKNYIDHRIIARLPYEEELLVKAKSLIAEHQIGIFLDVGANIGLYTVVMGQLPQIKKIVCFEPVRRNFNQLCANIFVNNMDRKVEPHCLAVGEQPGEATIHVAPDATGEALFDLNMTHRHTTDFSESETVKIVRLDDVLSFKNERIFMKIDVEGHAVKAIAGMQGLLAANDVLIQAELLEFDRVAIIDALQGQGYALIEEVARDGYFRKKTA